jgi:hypothetical protein
LTYFYDVELILENIFENLLIAKLYFEILLNFLNFLEFPAHLALLLLKFDDQIKKINEKYFTFYKNNFEHDEKAAKTWSSYFILYERLIHILDKIKNKITEEGADVKFTQNSEVTHHIN